MRKTVDESTAFLTSLVTSDFGLETSSEFRVDTRDDELLKHDKSKLTNQKT